MKATRLIALLLTVVMLTGCGTSAVPAATDAIVPETTLPPQTTAPTETPTEPSIPEPTEPEVTEPEVTEAPTEPPETVPEETEPPKALAEVREYNFVRVADYIPNIVQELAYATEDNFTGKVVYDFTDAYLRCGTLKKLMKAQEILNEQGYGLKIWDAFRPIYGQAKLYEAWPDPNYVSHPHYGNRPHCRGTAVDVTLVDLETGEELDMPTGFDDFTALADRNYDDCTEAQAANSKILESAMTAAGFSPYSAEWWHFTDPVAHAVDNYFDPAVYSKWKLQDDTPTILYASPEEEATPIIWILPDDQITLLGWKESYAYVEHGGFHGYVASDLIQPVNAPQLSIVAPTDIYSYDQMLLDIATLAETYPDIITVGSIGTSEDGRDLPLILLGDKDAKYQVLVQGTVHAMEHMCTWLLMSMTEYHAARGGISDVCFHIIPMMNPDGVLLSQTGEMNELQQEIYRSDLTRGYTFYAPDLYAEKWKANGHGIDINRAFDAGWELTNSRYAPSSQMYKGTEPFDCAEAVALRDYTLSQHFDVTVSYHATGNVIFWEYGQRKDINNASYSLAQELNIVTGYTLRGSSGVDAAGYKDWAIDALGIPSVTMEIGFSEVPLPYSELANVFSRNVNILPAIAKWLSYRQESNDTVS